MYVFDPGNPPRFAGEEHAAGPAIPAATPSPHHSTASLQSSSSPLLVHQELSKLSLDGSDTASMVYGGGWVVQQPPRPAPYILVNPVSPLPQYLPYVYPAFQVGSLKLFKMGGKNNVKFSVAKPMCTGEYIFYV